MSKETITELAGGILGVWAVIGFIKVMDSQQDSFADMAFWFACSVVAVIAGKLVGVWLARALGGGVRLGGVPQPLARAR